MEFVGLHIVPRACYLRTVQRFHPLRSYASSCFGARRLFLCLFFLRWRWDFQATNRVRWKKAFLLSVWWYISQCRDVRLNHFVSCGFGFLFCLHYVELIPHTHTHTDIHNLSCFISPFFLLRNMYTFSVLLSPFYHIRWCSWNHTFRTNPKWY